MLLSLLAIYISRYPFALFHQNFIILQKFISLSLSLSTEKASHGLLAISGSFASPFSNPQPSSINWRKYWGLNPLQSSVSIQLTYVGFYNLRNDIVFLSFFPILQGKQGCSRTCESENCSGMPHFMKLFLF